MKILATALLLAFGVLSALPAQAQLRVDVNKGKIEPVPVAISPFYPERPEFAEFAKNIPDIITNNLRGSGLFKPVSPGAFIQDAASIQKEGPRFAEWRAINAQALISGSVTRAPDGRTRVEFRLWDVFSQKQISGMAYMTNEQNWRRIAHIISDDVYKRVTGEDGYFDSRIIYVSETGNATKRIKRLAIMDQDGANHRYLTDEGTLVLTPRFSPTSQEITYMSYKNGKPRVYLYNIDSGRQEVMGDFPGMTFAPRFSPDGGKIIMSMAQGGNTDIYEMDLRSRKSRKLTDSSGIDTAPSYSPDARQVTFESDRSGTQQIYVMDSSGGNQKRITFGDGRYASPVWSPRGDLIAFIKMKGGQFYLGVIRPDGTGERLITQAYHVEGPTWSPNGRVIAYFKEAPGGGGRSSKLYSIDITGYNERQLPTPRDGSDPAWSPLNQ
ncbi:MAG: Tol-Pal system protein TolB [Micavibrio aeruginosavorus]|uniref:Tol-Pal system protein TolB n=1 Tax=Micavibrio aeruginosavorus TaxID=349221 RepID=A0A2W5BR04_9BACT|nr:MAG: Tol-Pal system protein TolB [Micavibrio aeruginosavorus]